MLLDLLSIVYWREFRIYAIMFCCLTLDSTSDKDRRLLAIGYADGSWMLDLFWIHILTRE